MEPNDGYFVWSQMYILIISWFVLLRMGHFSDKGRTEYRNTNSMFSNIFRKYYVYDIMWKKYCRTEEVTDKVTHNNVAHVHCMLDTKLYKLTLGICLSNCFTTASSASVSSYSTLPVLLWLCMPYILILNFG